jgi:peptide/nickel transport system permease protein
MTTYLIRRVAQAVVVVFGVMIIVFVLIHLLPGGEARAVLGLRATPAAVRAFNRDNGLDRPLVEQFLIYIKHLLEGNLGFSYHYDQSVRALLAETLPKTVLLMGSAYVLAFLIGVPLGVYQAVRRNRIDDYVLTGLGFFLYSMPVFWLGILLILLFSVRLDVLPPGAPQGSFERVITHPTGLVLPVLTLALVTIAWFSRYARSAVMDNLVQDYVRTARAKGLTKRRVLMRHVLRNSLIPMITLIGVSLPWIFSGALVVEAIFNYPGMGLLFWNAAQVQDYATLLGVTLIAGIATVLGSLLADLLYLVVDPRVRYVAP